MLSPKLWGTSVKGNVYTLHTNASEWVQVRNQHNVLQGFKKVIASPTGAWALGCDHQVYIYVEKSDVPIRCQVSTFENERWLPTQGWSGRNLLPAVDPFDWSSEDGHVHLPRGDFKLPSRGWEWEEEWRLDLNVRGFATDQQGWRYSHIGFQSGFTHKKTFKSCVRRRRWIRYRRYMAIDRWSKLASIHLDPLEEPIVDVTIGGYSLPNLEEGAASVWIVTIDGKIVLRSGVSQKIPEGVSWVHITLAGDDEEVVSISAGATSLVWAVTYHGAIIARTGITWQNLKGNKWVQIPAPEGLGKKDRVVQVSVGNESAWVVSSEGKVWFRKGISKTNPHGIGWLQMVDTMKMVAVIGQDKVIGVNIEDRQLYFRMGISRDEQSGRLWQLVDLPFTRMTQIPSGSICSEVSSFSDEGINIDANSAMEKYEQSRSRHSSENSLPMLSVTGELSGEHAETDVMQGGNQNNSGKTLQNYVTCWEKDTINADTSESDASCTVPGRKSSQSDTDTFLSMGLTNDFCGLELNLDEDQETYNTEGRGSFGHLTIDMDQDQHPSEDVDTERLMDHPSIVWDKSLQIKDSNSSEQKPKFSFNRLRTHIGNKLKSPVEVINKLKTTKPKEMLKDLKNDLQEGKKEVLGAISQAQEVFKHGKQENDMDKIKVTFKKEGDMAECENMELKFYDDSVNYTTNAETGNLVDTGGGNSNVKKSIPSNVDLESVTSGHITPSASLSTLSGSVFGEGDSDGHMSLLRPPEQDIGDIQWCWVSGCFMQDVEETRLKHWFYTDKGKYN